jgi:putative membrane protein
MKRISFLNQLCAAVLFVATPALLQGADKPATGAASAGGPAAGAAAAGSGEGVPAGANASGKAGGKAAAGAKSGLAKADEKFVQTAAQGGLMEVKLGEVASQKASAAEVKELGAMMVKDHSKANQELTDLAGKKGITLSTELESKHQATIDRLSKLSGEEFDKAYVSEMLSDHKKDVADFEKASKSATDEDIKAWAGKTLPTLQAHLQHVQGLKKGGKK